MLASSATIGLSGDGAAGAAKQGDGMIRIGLRAALALAIAIGFGFAVPAQAGPTLDKVKQAGTISCGVQTGVAGYAQPDSQGVYTGFNVDICHALSAAVFGDPDKVKFVPLTAQQRFTALQSGEVDLLSNNTTWTLQRDTELGLNFAPVVFYDGQGFMVTKKSGVKSAKELNGATICVQPGHHDRAQPRRLFPRQQDGVQAGRHRKARRADRRVLLRALRRLHRRFLGTRRRSG